MGKRRHAKKIDLEKELSDFGFDKHPVSDPEEEELGELLYELEDFALGPHAEGEHLNFVEREGEMYYVFVTACMGGEMAKYGKIPADVCSQGADAIRAHAHARMMRAVEPFKAAVKEDRSFRDNPNFVLTAHHDGQELRGTIIRADGRYYWLRMDHPFTIKEVKGGGYNQWSAMSGRFMFAKCGSKTGFSDDAINNARTLLVEIYKRHVYAAKNTDTIELAKRLNRKC